MQRRHFLKSTMTAAVAVTTPHTALAQENGWRIVDDFDRPDTKYHGDGWETLNPGFWKIENGTLRRRLKNIGDRNPTHWFPWHWETHRDVPMPMEWDPSLPFGMMWRRDWKLTGNFSIRAEYTVRALAPHPAGTAQAKQEKPGYGIMGITFGGRSQFEGRHGLRSDEGNWKGSQRMAAATAPPRNTSGNACWMAAWRDNNTFSIYDHTTDDPIPAPEASETTTPALQPGDRVTIELQVSGGQTATVTATMTVDGVSRTVTIQDVDRKKFTEGYIGLVSRGLLDFEVTQYAIQPGKNTAVDAPLNDLHICYPLGDTLENTGGNWHCTFMALFRSDGARVSIRVSDSPDPAGGWAAVPVAGSAEIVDNDFRRFTASVIVALPHNPADTTMYYTVWKDGIDVTADPRIGWLGRKTYVGRLPRLQAPYRLAGLGGHAIIGGGPNLPDAGMFQENWIHDQPTPDAYRYFEEHNLQILVWDDDVWYLELMFCPPSTDDAYKVITLTIAGPTSRWVMMQHWNIINPGDHDYGMDDVKGPEQYIIRQHEDLGQDRAYIRRNFQIVQHLITGKEHPSATDNPKHWRRWKMPAGDFSLLILDARLWRTSQDTTIWATAGWGHKKNLYDRTDPTRALLGEEQFAWLQEMIRTDSSSLMCLTGINAMHTIWGGVKQDPETGLYWDQRDRVAADYAGWVKAGSDRVLELLGSRQGVVTVFGDIHLASILENKKHHVYECSFGPIGRTGSRRAKPDFGPDMIDYDGRPLTVHALYHDRYGTPDLQPLTGPKIWNFLEMEFRPTGASPSFLLRIRNLVDPPGEPARGGGFVDATIMETGRPISCRLPAVTTLPNANVRLSYLDGRPVLGIRSTTDGHLPLRGLIDTAPESDILLVAEKEGATDAQVIRTLPL